MRSERTRLCLMLALAAASGCIVFDDKFYKALDPEHAKVDAGNGLVDSGLSADGGAKAYKIGDDVDVDGDGKADGKAVDDDGDGVPDGVDLDGDGNSDVSLPGAPMSHADAGSDAGKPTNMADAGTDAGPVEQGPLHLVDTCSDKDIFVLSDTYMTTEVSVIGFGDDITKTKCSIEKPEEFPSVPGPEGWLAINMVAGDRWHFHVHPLNTAQQGAQNPALYMRSDCTDDRMCNPGQYLNLCGNRQDEHFTFEAASTTRWLFALDDGNAIEGKYQLTVSKPVCGNKNQEHNEGCEDGNTDNNDGCSQDCRKELLSDNLTESEVNDDWTTANILKLVDTNSAQSVLGSVGGLCDLDMYSFNVPEKGNVRVTVKKANGDPCTGVPANATPVTLKLLNSDGRSLVGLGTIPNDGTSCPTIDASHLFAQKLSEGAYFISVSGDETKDAFNYKVTVTVIP